MGRAKSMNSQVPEPPSGAMPNMRSMKSILAPLLRPVAVEFSVLLLQNDVNVQSGAVTLSPFQYRPGSRDLRLLQDRRCACTRIDGRTRLRGPV
jgi:hypothetical protein